MADNDYAAKATKAGLPALAKLISAHYDNLAAELANDAVPDEKQYEILTRCDESYLAAIAEASSKRATELWMVCCDGKPKHHVFTAVGERTSEERARRLCKGRNATEDCSDVWTAHRVYLGDS